MIWCSSQQSPEQHALPWFGDQLILFGLNYWHHQLSVTINVIIIVNSKLKVWRPWTLSSSQDLIGRLSKWAFLVIVTTNTNTIIITNIVPPARGTGPFPPSGISGLLLLLLSSLSPFFYHHHHHYHNNIPYHHTNPPPLISLVPLTMKTWLLSSTWGASALPLPPQYPLPVHTLSPSRRRHCHPLPFVIFITATKSL